ncbi:MAG: SelL-related redox protein [Saprospiraceae bacterium]
MVVPVEEIDELITVRNRSVIEISFHKKVLLVFMRHFGCSFCREAMADLQKLDAEKSNKNFEIILVHMSNSEVAEEYFKKFKIGHLDHISDQNCVLYNNFGLTKANFNQLFGFRSWIRGIETGLLNGHGWGMQLGDGFQMPGIFTINKGKVVSEFRHKFPSDKPDYEKLVNCRMNNTK